MNSVWHVHLIRSANRQPRQRTGGQPSATAVRVVRLCTPVLAWAASLPIHDASRGTACKRVASSPSQARVAPRASRKPPSVQAFKAPPRPPGPPASYALGSPSPGNMEATRGAVTATARGPIGPPGVVCGATIRVRGGVWRRQCREPGVRCGAASLRGKPPRRRPHTLCGTACPL